MTEREYDIDLGDGHLLKFFCWAPDRDLNPQYEGIADVEKFGALIKHPAPEGARCNGRELYR